MSVEVKAWMRRAGGSVADAATGMEVLASSLGEVEDGMLAHLGDAGSAMGWEGALTARADTVTGANRPLLRRLAEAAQSTGTALSTLASALAEHGPAVTRLEGQIQALEADPPRTMMNDTVGQVEVVDWPELTRQRAVLEAELADHVSALADADRACRAVLVAAEADVMGLTLPGTSPDWTRSLVPPDLWGLFERRGVADTGHERRIARQIRPGMSPAELRELLRAIPVERLAAFLARHPDATTILAGDHQPLAGDDPVLGGLYAAMGGQQCFRYGVPPAESVGAIADYWAGLSEQDRTRLRLLYPAFVGNLDGVAIEDRALANRMLIRDALLAERLWEAAINAGPNSAEVRAATMETLRDRWWWNPISDWSAGRTIDLLQSDTGLIVSDVGMGHPDRELARSRSRIALYESLLFDPPVAPHGGTPLGADHRVVLVFDPRGDGMFAEWHGGLDAPQVGIFVPGTMTDMANIGRYNDTFRSIAEVHADTAMITWMGTDLPDAVAADARLTQYSVEGGHRLTSFVEGMAFGPDQTSTIVGHSAGGAIAGFADFYGVNVDRIFHVASAGTGPGVDHADKYPPTGIGGTLREVERYSMTAPGDSIEVAQDAGRLSWAIPDDWGHGYDPDTTPGFIRLETGRFADGTRLEGFESHSHVVQPGTDAWNNIVGVIRGGQVTPYREEFRNSIWGWRRGWRNVYDDPDYPGTDPVPLTEAGP